MKTKTRFALVTVLLGALAAVGYANTTQPKAVESCCNGGACCTPGADCCK